MSDKPEDLVQDHGPVTRAITNAGFTAENIPWNHFHSLFVQEIMWIRSIGQYPQKEPAQIKVECGNEVQRRAYELLSMTSTRRLIEGGLAHLPSLEAHSGTTQTQFYPVFQVEAGWVIKIMVQDNR
ncbi:MAG TPA: hypothetical protein VGE62_01440 [Candidatus Paceibacterota bacterium]